MVKQIKEAMLFNKYYKMGLIRYPNLTKDIADFYNSLTIDELQDINKKEVISKRWMGYTLLDTNYVDKWTNFSKRKEL